MYRSDFLRPSPILKAAHVNFDSEVAFIWLPMELGRIDDLVRILAFSPPNLQNPDPTHS
jgi:hypothetical protein